MLSKKDMQELAVLLDKGEVDQLIAVQQFLSAVINDKIGLATQELGLIRELETKESEE
jgi:hypothetical protein